MIDVWLAAVTVIALGALAVASYALVEIHDLREQLDRADEASDLALGKVQAIEAHLSGLEPAGAGRHADGQPTTYRRPPITSAHPDLESGSR